MKNEYTVLLIEDQPDDAELIELQLAKSELDMVIIRIQTISGLMESLEQDKADLVISDYNLGDFTGKDALDIVKNHSDLPFILVSGYLGEKKAVEIMVAGADDYINKDELERLRPVVVREILHYRERVKIQQQRDVALHHLQERVKEQQCLHQISRMDEQKYSISELLSKVVDYLPAGLQYPGITEAIIKYDGNSYQTENYRDTPWSLTATNDTITNGPLIIQVIYLEEKSALDIGPFLTEEQHLIESVLDILSLKINRLLDKKELDHKQKLLESANDLAQIGNWEVDLVESTMMWSPQVYKIHEMKKGYEPILSEGLNFYKEGKHRDTITEAFTKAVEQGIPWDLELIIVTGRGNERWIRTIGQPVFKNGRCVRVYGSFQNIDKRKRAESQMKMLSKVASETQDAVIITTLDREIEWVNRAFEKQTGYLFEEVKGKKPDFLQGSDTNQQTVAFMHEKLENREEFTAEILNYTKTGEPYWVDLDVSPITDEHGNVVKFFSIQEDITERKNNVSQLNEKQHRLEEAQRIGKIGDWDYDIQTGEIFWSDQMYEIYDRDPSLGPPGYEELAAYYPEDAELHHEMVERAFETGESYALDLKLHTEKGKEKYIHADGFANTDEQGTTVKLHGVVQDITDRKAKELELAANQRQITAIVDNIEGVLYRYILRPDGTDKMVYISSGIERILGVTTEEAKESTEKLWKSIDKRDLDRFTKSVEKSAETLQPWYEEYRIETPQGEKKWIRGTGRPTQLKNGTIQWDTLIVDITDEVRQQQVNETLVQEIHHRVKNNLAIIIGFLELQLEDLNEQSPERLTLERAMTRIYSIAEIHKLLHEGSNLVDINVKKYMDHLIEHITDTINVGDGLHVDLQVDRLQMNVNELTPLGMLLSELLTNSAKYAFKRNNRGHIQINISSLNGSYNVRYHDTGPGIDKLEFENPKDTDFNIVHLLLRQLEADYKLLNKDGFGLEFTFKERQKGAHSNIGI